MLPSQGVQRSYSAPDRRTANSPWSTILLVLGLAGLVFLTVLVAARPAVAQGQECIGEPVRIDVAGAFSVTVAVSVCEEDGDSGDAAAQPGQPQAPKKPKKPKAQKPQRPQGDGGRRDREDGGGTPSGGGKSVPASPKPSAQAPAGASDGQLALASRDSSTTPRGGSGDRRDLSRRADAQRGDRVKRDARADQRDPRADRTAPALVPGLPPPGTASGRRGWWPLPLPLLGLLLLALAGAWLLAGRRSERLALAGSAGRVPAGEEPQGKHALAGLAALRGKAEIKPRVLAELATIAAVVVASVLALQALVVKPVRIPSESMVPTLALGQEVLVERLSLRFGEPDRGDIVVFNPPAGADGKQCGVPRAVGEACSRPTGGQLDSLFIKRVVAEPGERLKILQGRVYIDGKLQRGPQLRGVVGCNVCNLPREITIPPGHFFVMGDNRGDSIDSRFWGPVPEDQIIGRAVFSYWPPRRFGPL